MVSRILAPYFRLRQDTDFPPPNFDVQHADGSGPLNQNVNVRSEEHTALAREIAGASTVLLKNTGVLPLKSTNGVRSAAIIGMDAAMPKDGCNQNECNEGVMVIGWGSGSYALTNVVPPVTSLFTQLTTALSPPVPATAIATSLINDIASAQAAAKGKDVAFVFANAMSGELGFYDIVAGHMGDRNDLELWYKGGNLVGGFKVGWCGADAFWL
jgi:beta-glucosidase